MKSLYNVTFTNTKTNTTDSVAVWAESMEEAKKMVTRLAPWRVIDRTEEVNATYFASVITRAKARREA